MLCLLVGALCLSPGVFVIHIRALYTNNTLIYHILRPVPEREPKKILWFWIWEQTLNETRIFPLVLEVF